MICWTRGWRTTSFDWNQEKLSNEVLKPGKLPWERVLCTNDLFKMDEEDGTTAYDSSSNNNNGTLENMNNDDWVTSTAPIGDNSHMGSGNSNLYENAEKNLHNLHARDCNSDSSLSYPDP